MTRERDIERRLHALQGLSEAIKAMKRLSAHHLRASREAREPARTYRLGVEACARQAGATMPAGTGPSGILIIGAELGLCGAYNRDVARAGAELASRIGPGPVFALGRRMTQLARRMGTTIEHAYPGPSSLAGIPGTLAQVTEDLLGCYVRQGLRAIHVVSCPFAGVGTWEPTTVRLLPLQSAPTTTSTIIRYATAQRLASVALRELLYITLFGYLLDALACEQGARLVATQGAQTWLDRHSRRLRRQLVAARREASTQEVIEIASGARARSLRHPGSAG